MTAPKEILDLVERFDRNRDAYKSPQYNETQLRREFLDPFFCALGWDVENKQGHAEVYKDVIHEDAIKIGGFTKAPAVEHGQGIDGTDQVSDMRGIRRKMGGDRLGLLHGPPHKKSDGKEL